MTPIKNYYKILGINHHASREEIRTAYRTLAKIYHPDKNNNSKVSEEQFKEVLEAFRVLSDDSQRKKYDLKLKYGLSYTYTARSKQSENDAYKKYGSRKSARKTPPPAKPKSFFERYQVTLSFIASAIILYLISRYSGEALQPKIKAPHPGAYVQEQTFDTSSIRNADSPYEGFFGKAIQDPNSKNLVAVINGSHSEAVVCLVEILPEKHRVIRNEYLRPGTTYTFNHIPNGMYYLKTYFGNAWDPEKKITDSIRGGFRESVAFVRTKPSTAPYIMKQSSSGKNVSFSAYETILHPESPDVELITAKDFFSSAFPR